MTRLQCAAASPALAVGRVYTWAAISLIGLGCGACSLVKPEPDYTRARDAIKASTGQEAVWMPDEPGMTEEQLKAIFAEGLTEKEAVQIAMLNNRELQAVFYDIGVARADWAQSGLLANPVVNTGLRFPTGGGSLDLLGDFSQNIADMWQIPMRKQAAEGAVEQAVMRVAGVGSTVAGSARAAYQSAVAAEELALLTDDNAHQASKTTEVVRSRQGGSSTLDVDMVKGDAMQAYWDAQEAKTAVADTRHQLAKTLSLVVLPDDVKLTDRLSPPGPVPLDAGKAVAVARLKRVDLQAAAQAVGTAESRIKTEYTKMLPGFNLGADMERRPEIEDESTGYGRIIRNRIRDNSRGLANRLITGATGTTLSLPSTVEEIEPEDKLKIGPALAVTVPIYDQNLAQIAKAKFLHQQAIKQHELLETNAVHDVALHHSRASLAAKNLAFFRDQLMPQAEKNLATASSDYKVGQTSAIALLDAQRTLFDARRRHLTARLNSSGATGDLESAIGMPLAAAAALTPEQLSPPAPAEADKSLFSLPLPKLAPPTDGKSILNMPVSPALPTLPGNLQAPTIKPPVDTLLEIVPKPDAPK